MTPVHVVVGVALIAVNTAAGALGVWRWRRGELSRVFWPLLRAGQAIVVIQAVLGGVLLVAGKDLPRLHLVYGLTPLAVAFFAEQLRAISAQTELDKRGLQGRADVERLSETDQRLLVEAILRREVGVMAISALVVVALGVRASGWL